MATNKQNQASQHPGKIEIASDEDVRQYAPAGSAEASDSSHAPPQSTASEQQTDWHERFLRAKADFQNLQRRSQDERETAVRFANSDFARAILDVVDDLERTLQATENTRDPESLLHGVQLTHENLLKILRNHDVEPIESEGLPFDPTRHEAMMQREDHEHPPGTVIEELRKGYKMHDRIIRPARVVVSRAPEEQHARE